MQPWHVFGRSINAARQRRIGDSVPEGSRAGWGGVVRSAAVATRGRMTESAPGLVHWLLGTIVTFAATIYDDWNNGRYVSVAMQPEQQDPLHDTLSDFN